MAKILLIDDEPQILETTSRWLSLADYDVETFSSAEQALKNIASATPDVIVSDVKMRGCDGLELLEKIVAADPTLPVILITGHGDISMAVTAMQGGAYYFIEKPFDPDHLVEVIKRAVQKRALAQENSALKTRLKYLEGIESRIIGESHEVRRLRSLILSLAPLSASVIINGKTGTGKELVASCLHEFSDRAKQPFAAINCGAVPEDLLESELFGHERGAFTGANQRRIGTFEYAKEGTLFLDEIETMPHSFQVKLLRALQEKTISRLGSNTQISVSPRIVVATKVNLTSLVEQGKFREDLYYRLKVAEIHLPSLKKRPDDILLLFKHFYFEACRQFNIDEYPLEDKLVAYLMHHNWPGNVREIGNFASQYAIGTITGQQHSLGIDSEDTPEGPRDQPPQSLHDTVNKFEENIICEALKRHQGNIKAVMEELQVSRRTLNDKMLRFDILRSDYSNG